jgi:hypothetical protein
MERTIRWSERALAAHSRPDQALFGIVQGGVDPGLRVVSARRTTALGFSGFGIGGLAVGETPDERNRTLEVTFAELPPSAPRYVMGLGDPEGVIEAVARGADLFDCVWPTRLARHGRVFTADGDYNLRRAEYGRDSRPPPKSARATRAPPCRVDTSATCWSPTSSRSSGCSLSTICTTRWDCWRGLERPSCAANSVGSWRSSGPGGVGSRPDRYTVYCMLRAVFRASGGNRRRAFTLRCSMLSGFVASRSGHT